MMEHQTDTLKTKRTYRTHAVIEGLVQEYRRSGLSQVAFARENGLKVGSLRGWLYKNKKSGTEGLCEVVVRGEGVERGKASAIVRMLNGSEVELPLCAGTAWVERMIRELVR